MLHYTELQNNDIIRKTPPMNIEQLDNNCIYVFIKRQYLHLKKILRDLHLYLHEGIFFLTI